MFVDVDERDHDAQPCEVECGGQHPCRIQVDCGSQDCEHGHESAEQLDRRVASGNRFLAVAALAVEYEEGNDRDVVVPADLRLAVRAEAAFRVHDADAVGHAPDDHVEKRADEAPEHERDDGQHHGGDTVAVRARVQMRHTIADQNITGGKDGGCQHYRSPLPVRSVHILAGCVADGCFHLCGVRCRSRARTGVRLI